MRERLTLPGHRVSYVRNSIYYIRNYALAENASLRDFIMHSFIIYVITVMIEFMTISLIIRFDLT
jgi:hypothetical protein